MHGLASVDYLKLNQSRGTLRTTDLSFKHIRIQKVYGLYQGPCFRSPRKSYLPVLDTLLFIPNMNHSSENWRRTFKLKSQTLHLGERSELPILEGPYAIIAYASPPSEGL
jgi:hypothetical protein